MDRFLDLLGRLPIPGLIVFVGVYLFIVGGYHALLWLDGTLPVGELLAAVVVEGIWYVALPAAWFYLRAVSATGLDMIGPALGVADEEFVVLRSRFTRLSARTGWIVTGLGIGITPLIWSLSLELSPWMGSPYARYMTFAILAAFPLNLAFVVAVVQWLRGVDRVYTLVRDVDLFHPAPLYSLSRVTARIGLVFLTFLVIGALTNSIQFEGGSSAAVGIFYASLWTILAICAFVIPLLGMHRRLKAAKSAALHTNGALLGAGYDTMQQAAILGDTDAISRSRLTVGALAEYQTALSKVSTWPWDPGTVRGFGTALLIPIAVWGLQQALLRAVS